MKPVVVKSTSMRSETKANPWKLSGNPHEFRDAGIRGAVQGRRAREGKSYSGNPYSPNAAQMVRKRATLTINRSNTNSKDWANAFEMESGFKFKPYKKAL